MIAAIIPAVHEPGISDTIRSLLAQDPAPDVVLVAINNTDDPTTEEAAAAVGDPRVEVLNLGAITGRKAGALNRALVHLAPAGGDLVLVVDADTTLAPGWISRALTELQDPAVGAVGAVFRADQSRGWLRGSQFREYARYAEEIDRTGKTFVVSGTGALIRAEALTGLVDARGFAYHEGVLTEDFEITVALKRAGWDVRSPVECGTETDTMSTVRDLIRQRVRWQRGALEVIRFHGFHRETLVYWKQQGMIALSVVMMILVVSLSVILGAIYGVELTAWSLVILAAFLAERVVTVWDAGARHRVAAALIFPELAYALILQFAYVVAAVKYARGSAGEWHQN